MRNNQIFVLLTFLCGLGYIHCEQYEVIPQRAHLEYINPKYILWGKVNVRRYGRKSAYYLNVEGETKVTWTNNVTLSLIFNEFLSNEYRRSFVELHYRYCDMITNDQLIGKLFRLHGMTCPLPAKEHHVTNITVPMDSFRNKFPFEKTRVDVIASVPEKKENIFVFQLFALIKEIIPKKTKV